MTGPVTLKPGTLVRGSSYPMLTALMSCRFCLIMCFWVCYNNSTHRCQSKTLSHPDFESTYTNKASLEALAVC